MPAVVDRLHGCFKQVTKSGTTYPYSLNLVESQVGRKFDIYSTFLDYTTDYPGNAAPPSPRATHDDVAAAAAAGKKLLVAFQPIVGYFNDGTGTYRAKYGTFAELLAGTYDTTLTGLFTWLLSLGVDVIVRPFWEGNLSSSAWYPDDSTQSHAQSSTTYTSGKWWITSGTAVCTSTAQYKSAFQYLATLLRSLPNASTHLKMFYCPGCNDPSSQVALGASGTTLVNMYPGSAAVDINGYDSYNTVGSTWQNAQDTLKGYRVSDSTNRYAYDLFAALNSKPIWLGEINCMDVGDTTSGAAAIVGTNSKSAWYTDLFSLPTTFAPLIEGIAWFDQPGTRSTWPFTSSAAALAGFQQGFNFGTASGGTQHGTVADPVAPGGDGAIDPAPSVTYPFRTDHFPGEKNHAATFNKIAWVLNRVTSPIGSYISGKFGTDGSDFALTVTGDMGVSAFTPLMRFIPPAVAGATRKYIIGSRQAANTYYNYRLRDDGRQEFGPGDTADVDLIVARTAASVLSILSGSSGDAGLTVANLNQKFANFTDQSNPASPGNGAAVLFGSTSGISMRDVGGVTKAKFGQHDSIFSSQVMPYDPAVLVTTGTPTPPQLTSGVMATVQVRVFSARALTRLCTYVHTAGATLSFASMGLYDSAGTFIADIGDQTTAWTTTGIKNSTTTSGPTIQPGTYYIGALATTSGGTMPRLVGVVNSFGNYTGTPRFGTYGTGLTALPASITVGSIAAAGNAFHFSLT